MDFLSEAEQANLLQRVQTAQSEVTATQTLVKLMDSQAGVDTSVLLAWHQLVTECWHVSIRHRSAQSTDLTDQS